MHPRTESFLSRRTFSHVDEAKAEIEVKTNRISDKVFVNLIVKGLTPGVRAVNRDSVGRFESQKLSLK